MKREYDMESVGAISGSIKSKYKLLILDFDFTMTNCHTHNKAILEGKQKAVTVESGLVVDGKAYGKTEIYEEYDPEALEAWSKEFFGEENRFVLPEGQIEFIRDSLKDGVKVVIASHSKYPKLIEVGLVHLGLTPDEIARIHVICGEPLDPANGKNEHIDIAKELHGIKDYSDVLLVDDSGPNRSAAIKRGIDVVSVTPFVPYLYDAKLKMGYIEEDNASTDYEDSDEQDSEASEETIPEFIKLNKLADNKSEVDEDGVDTVGDVEFEGSEH